MFGLTGADTRPAAPLTSWTHRDGSLAVLSPGALRTLVLASQAAIFVGDLMVSQPLAMLHMVPVAVAFWSRDATMPMTTAVVASVLSLAGLLAPTEGLEFERALYARAIGVPILLATGWIASRHRRLLLESASRESVLRAILESEPACVAVLAADGTVLDINRSGVDMLEAGNRERVVGSSACSVLETASPGGFDGFLRRVAGGASCGIQASLVTSSGESRWLDLRATPLRGGPTEPDAVLVVAHDVSDAKRAESQRDALARRLLEVQEEERQSVARDLHDEIGQSLSALVISLQGTLRDSPGRPDTDRCLQIALEALRQVKGLALSLRPTVLDDLGLAAAVHWFAERTARRTDLTVACTVDPNVPPAPPAVAIACFRILQEAMSNVLRHSGAQRVEIQLHVVGPALELVVRDNGNGFDVTRRPGGLEGGLGLLGMAERAALLGGEARVSSEMGRGTEVRLRLPLVPTGAESEPLPV